MALFNCGFFCAKFQQKQPFDKAVEVKMKKIEIDVGVCCAVGAMSIIDNTAQFGMDIDG